MYFLITESPAKAKKIQSFLDNKKYLVKSSCGHIIDLEKKKLSIDVDNDFKPSYKVLSDKKEIVKMLKDNSKNKTTVIASDDDREGEAIGWHCSNTLKLNLNDNNRIVFREISKNAILKSLENPKKININEVNAQQTRRIIDRLIGFKLSPCLWKHIKTKETGLSAGRVQSALLNLLEQKELEIKNYDPDISLSIIGTFDNNIHCDFIFTNNDIDIDNHQIKNLFENFIKENNFEIISKKISKDKSYPKKPFITSTLQQSAQNELGFPVKMTMNIAQKLYESGFITYMRTDSTFISEEFVSTLKKNIKNNYGKEFYQKPKEKKIKGAQEAHEAIRPTNLNNDISDLDQNETKLYNFIVKRTITSYMKPAEYNIYHLKLSNNITSNIGYFLLKQKQLTFQGYLIYNNKNLKCDDIPEFNTNYQLNECVSTEKEDNKPNYYNESSIVKLLEDTGIGRPSTYATIISTLDNRNYTIKKDFQNDDILEKKIILKNNKISECTEKKKSPLQKQRILLTPLGLKVLSYLKEHFSNILHKNFTCNVENDLDLIAKGELNHIDVIRKVYQSFIEIVDRQMNLKLEKSSLKLLGEKQSKQIYIGDGKYGCYLQIVNSEKMKKNVNIDKFIELKQKNFDSFDLNDAIEILKYPKKINKNIYIHIGPYGYYMKYKNKNYKINQTGTYSEKYCLTLIK